MELGNLIEAKDTVTTLAAIVGMVLGIYNFFSSRSADKVRLQVIPKAATYSGHEYSVHNRDRYDLERPALRPDSLSLEIINMSRFAVTIDEVGLKPSWSQGRLALAVPIITDGKPWPRKLEPRENVVVYFDVIQLLGLENIGSVSRAYATTTCGTTCYGSSGALRDFVRIARGLVK